MAVVVKIKQNEECKLMCISGRTIPFGHQSLKDEKNINKAITEALKGSFFDSTDEEVARSERKYGKFRKIREVTIDV